MIIREVFSEELETVSKLAHEIWPVVYKDIMSADQMEFMLNWMYSKDSLQTQLQEGHRFFIAFDKISQPLGYSSFSLFENSASQLPCFKLHKLYVRVDKHKKGIGKSLLMHVVRLLAISKPCSLILNVNRSNPSRFFYEHLGFKITQEVDNEIGNGFFMNDYVMKLEIQ